MEIYGKEDMPYLYSPEEFIEKSYRVINARSFDFDGIEYSKEFADKYKPRFGIDLKVSKKEKDNENIDFDDIEF